MMMRKVCRMAMAIAVAGLVAANAALYVQVKDLEARVQDCENSQTLVIDSMRKAFSWGRVHEEMYRLKEEDKNDPPE